MPDETASKNASDTRTFTAPEGTEIATQTTDEGERVDVSFPDGEFTTDDEALAEVLAALAADPAHPVKED